MLPEAISDRYRLIQEIGMGGMGRVWRASDSQGRAVAVKILKQSRLEARQRERFVREACLAARVHHPHVVGVLDVGVMNGLPYVAMELVEGVPFDEWLTQRQPTLEEVLEVIEQILSGIQAVHEAGVLHRDIKPANVLVSSTEQGHRAKLIDFGISVGADDERLTQHGHLIGSLRWMSPERARDESDIDSRSDLFSVGLMLRLAITGHLPYADLSMPELTQAVRGALLRPMRNDWLPDRLVAEIDRACSRSPDDRRESAAAMQHALSALRTKLPSNVLEHAVGMRTSRSSWHSLSSNPSALRQLMLVSILGLVLVLVTSGFLLRSLFVTEGTPTAIEEPA